MDDVLKQSLDYISCKPYCFQSANPGKCICGAEELIKKIKKQIADGYILWPTGTNSSGLWYNDTVKMWDGIIPSNQPDKI